MGCPVGRWSFLLLQVAIECRMWKGKRGIDAAIDDACPLESHGVNLKMFSSRCGESKPPTVETKDVTNHSI